ncbi:MAG: autotransporter-associated beta strand repeat-containing protein [Chlamydiota bacterium]
MFSNKQKTTLSILTLSSHLFGSNWTGGAAPNTDWINVANWDAGVPNAVDAEATFRPEISTTTVDLTSGPFTIGNLGINSNEVITIGAANTPKLTIQTSSGNGQITFSNQPHKIMADLTLSSNTVVTQNATSAVEISGNIDGSGNLIKAGAGTLILSGNDSYTGTTTINNGTLAITNHDNLENSSEVTIASNGTLVPDSVFGVTIQALFGDGTIDIQNTPFLIQSGSFSGTITSSPAAVGALTKTTSGTLLLAGKNSYQNPTELQGGILQVGTNQSLGTTTINFAGGTLQPINDNLVLNNNAEVGSDSIIDTQQFSFTFSGAINNPYFSQDSGNKPPIYDISYL